MTEIYGTFVGRWYVTALAIVFLWCAVRHLGWKRTLVYTAAAVGIGVVTENASVHYGIPYGYYSFNEDLRGTEIFVGSAPLMVSLSYTFMGYFAFATGRLLASGPWRTRARRLWHEYLLGVVLGVWAIWIYDPIAQLGGEWFLGELFAYEAEGIWFGLTLRSQIGFTIVTAAMVGVLTWLARDEENRSVRRWTQHPHLLAIVTYHAVLVWLATMALVVGETELGVGVALMWVPAAAVTAVAWSNLRTFAEARQHEVSA